MFSSEDVVSAISADLLVFAIRIIELFGANGVEITTLSISDYFTGEYWNTESITIDVLQSAIDQSGVTDTTITFRYFLPLYNLPMLHWMRSNKYLYIC